MPIEPRPPLRHRDERHIGRARGKVRPRRLAPFRALLGLDARQQQQRERRERAIAHRLGCLRHHRDVRQRPQAEAPHHRVARDGEDAPDLALRQPPGRQRRGRIGLREPAHQQQQGERHHQQRNRRGPGRRLPIAHHRRGLDRLPDPDQLQHRDRAIAPGERPLAEHAHQRLTRRILGQHDMRCEEDADGEDEVRQRQAAAMLRYLLIRASACVGSAYAPATSAFRTALILR